MHRHAVRYADREADGQTGSNRIGWRQPAGGRQRACQPAQADGQD
jgi:hypothetical protein